MNRRHKTVLALSLAVAGLALLNGATILQALGTILVGGSLAWLIGSQFVLTGAMFVWRHRIWAAIIATVVAAVSYGWIRYDAYQTKKREATEAAGAVLLNPGETLGPPIVSETPTPPPGYVLEGSRNTPTRPARRGKAILKRNTCDDLVVYDRGDYSGGDPLVIDQLAAGASVQVLGHVTVGDEDIIKTPNGQRGFVRSGCLEAIPVTKNELKEP